MNYQEYINSQEWKRKRDNAVVRADKHCALCSERDDLNVHHNTYERLGWERDSDLVVLCKKCHKKFHVVLEKYAPKRIERSDQLVVTNKCRSIDPIVRKYFYKRKAMRENEEGLSSIELAEKLMELRKMQDVELKEREGQERDRKA